MKSNTKELAEKRTAVKLAMIERKKKMRAMLEDAMRTKPPDTVVAKAK